MAGSPPALLEVSWSKSGSWFVCAWKPLLQRANMKLAPATKSADVRSASSRCALVSGDGSCAPLMRRTVMRAGTSVALSRNVCRTMSMARGGSRRSCSQLRVLPSAGGSALTRSSNVPSGPTSMSVASLLMTVTSPPAPPYTPDCVPKPR